MLAPRAEHGHLRDDAEAGAGTARGEQSPDDLALPDQEGAQQRESHDGKHQNRLASPDSTQTAAEEAPKPVRKPRKRGKHRLRHQTPRVLDNHRSTKGRAFAAVFQAINRAWVLDDARRDVAVNLSLDTLDLRATRREIEALESRQRMTKTVRQQLQRARRRALALSRNVAAMRKVLTTVAERRATRVPSIAELFSEVAPSAF
jgi:hypothetical protein